MYKNKFATVTICQQDHWNPVKTLILNRDIVCYHKLTMPPPFLPNFFILLPHQKTRWTYFVRLAKMQTNKAFGSLNLSLKKTMQVNSAAHQ